ncbi:unnamed protein product [Toxocara canis]|uniref:G_PROTEIN_RECEP_F1_2 domain-containing protein n=1 Tax=Toxocara canis TaxID=6265 RepID=A0A183U0R7_TOXCA|nr:unnamed protein product [Toxocara canis]
MASVNCFGDDRYEDVQLFYCQLPANESICELLQQMYDVKEARALLVAIPLTLSFLAAILNGSFGAMTILFCARNKYPFVNVPLLFVFQHSPMTNYSTIGG